MNGVSCSESLQPNISTSSTFLLCPKRTSHKSGRRASGLYDSDGVNANTPKAMKSRIHNDTSVKSYSRACQQPSQHWMAAAGNPRGGGKPMRPYAAAGRFVPLYLGKSRINASTNACRPRDMVRAYRGGRQVTPNYFLPFLRKEILI